MEFQKLYIIVVCYNHLIEETPNFKILKEIKQENVQCIFVDNSIKEPIKTKNKETCRRMKFEYIDMNGNKGISKAYNAAIATIDDKQKNNWIMTLDQDTSVSKDYFDNVLISIQQKNSYPLKTGYIYFGDAIGSPVKLNKLKKVEKHGNIYNNVEAINSCLVIKLEKITEINGYDDDLFLDMVDYYLMYRMREIGINSIEIIDGKIEQDFSGSSFSAYESDRERFKLYVKDFKCFSEKTNMSKVKKNAVLFKRALRLSLHHKKNLLKYI